MVLVSETTSAVSVGSGYRTANVPVMYLHPGLAPAMELADGGYNYASQEYIKVINIGHYVTSNLVRDGFVDTADSPSRFSMIGGNVVGTILAEKYNDNSRYSIVAVEKGINDQLGYPVPARRLFMFVASQTYDNLNSVGENLFQRGVEWTLGAE